MEPLMNNGRYKILTPTGFQNFSDIRKNFYLNQIESFSYHLC
jgi:hypothetical protein